MNNVNWSKYLLVYLVHRDSQDACYEAPIPWAEMVLEPSKFYDTGEFAFPVALKDPTTFTSFETLAIVEFLNANRPVPFNFRRGISTASDDSEAPIGLAQKSPETTPPRSSSPSDTPSGKSAIDPKPPQNSPSVSPAPPVRTPTPTPPLPPPSHPKNTGRKGAKKRSR